MSRVLYLDIETSPIVSYTWGIWEQNVIRKKDEWRILCYAYKWEGEKIEFVKSKKDDKELLRKLHKLLDEADFVVAHNGAKFDLPKIRARMMHHGMKPYSPIKVIDTLKMARKHGFDSKKLDELGDYSGLGRKTKHQGFDLWLGCMNNVEKDWKIMERYNRKDVELLCKVYKWLLPWSENHPVLDYERACPCGSNDIQFRGWTVTKKPKRIFQCKKCSKYGSI